MKLYPRASENRRNIHDPDIKPKRIAFFKEAVFNFLILQLLFLCLFAYIFGSLSQQNNSVNNLPVLFVDYDGGPVAAAVRTAYQQVQGHGFPWLVEHSDIEVAALRDQVCSIGYWASIYVVEGASDRLTAALGGGEAARNYDVHNAVKMIWNEVRWPAVVDSAIASNLQSLSTAARSAYLTANASHAITSANATDPAAAAVLADPWVLSVDNIQATVQGPRMVYNTLVVVLILVQEFFYLGTINGLYARFRIFATLRPRRIIVVRFALSLSYALIGSLSVSGMIWAFRAGWDVSGGQFALTWITLWLFGHINFLVLDMVTVWFGQAYVPMGLITWVILNVTSILVPFELNPGFFRWAYALPGHEVFLTLLDIWSSGCNPQLQISLPVLFAWELVGLAGSALGVYRRCHDAVVADEREQGSFQDRLNAALAHERARDERRQKERENTEKKGLEQVPGLGHGPGPGPDPDGGAIELTASRAAAGDDDDDDEEAAEKKRLETLIRSEDGKLRRLARRASRPGTFAFPLAFKTKDDGDEEED